MIGSVNETSAPSLTSLAKERDFNHLISEIVNSAHIRKAIFVYKKSLIDGTLEFIRKFEGVTQVQKELNINHDVIKKHASNNTPYKERKVTLFPSQAVAKTQQGGEDNFSYKRLP